MTPLDLWALRIAAVVGICGLSVLVGIGIGVVLAWLEDRAVSQRTSDADRWDGTIVWPTESDIVDGLRECAGDADDTRRRYLDAIIAMEERTH